MAIKKNLKKQGGRPPKADPAKIRYSISFTEEEHARFLTLFEQSGMLVKAHYEIDFILQSISSYRSEL